MWARRVDQRWFNRGRRRRSPGSAVWSGRCRGVRRTGHPRVVAEVLLQRGVVGLRRRHLRLEQHPPINRQPAPVEGLHLVRHRHMGVQIRIPGPTVPMGERGRDQAADVDLPDALRAGPGEQRMLLNEPQRILHRGLMGPFDDRRDGRVGDRPQRRHRLHRGEGQVVAGNRLGPRPGVFGDLPGQLPRIHRLPAMLRGEELACHLGADPGPVRRRHRPIPGQTGRLVDGGDPFRHLDPERADVAVEDLERRPQPGHRQQVGFGQVRSLELLQSQLGQRVHTGAEQRPHLLRGHRVAGVEAVDAGHPRTDPHPGLLAPFGVVGGQAGVALLGRIQRRHLPGQIVIPRPGGQLVHAHRHTYISEFRASRRSLGRGVLLVGVLYWFWVLKGCEVGPLGGVLAPVA